MDFTVFLCRNQHFFGVFVSNNNKNIKSMQNKGMKIIYILYSIKEK